jgi:hypothetical protein
MTTPRRRTINSRGEIVTPPYGVGRWSSPKKYACAHRDCAHQATILMRANAHGDAVSDHATQKAHNCCGTH